MVAAAFGATVPAERIEAGMAQEEPAHIAGVKRSHMGKIESGEPMPTLSPALKVALALGLSAAELIGRTEAALPATYRVSAD